MGPSRWRCLPADSKTVLRGGYGIFWAPQIYLGGPFATSATPTPPNYKEQTYAQLMASQGFTIRSRRA